MTEELKRIISQLEIEESTGQVTEESLKAHNDKVNSALTRNSTFVTEVLVECNSKLYLHTKWIERTIFGGK